MTYYLDADFCVHVEPAEMYTPWEDTSGFFTGKCQAFIEGYRVVPEGFSWMREDGIIFTGLMIAPCQASYELEGAQKQHERALMDKVGKLLTDEQAVGVPELYRQWQHGWDYATGDRRVYEGVLYRCLATHTAQEYWTPANATSLWTKVLIADPCTIPAWEQPESTDPYMLGDKVSHNGKIWVSTVDNNSWEPGVFGWDEVSA